jgi:type II secretory pathway component PulK
MKRPLQNQSGVAMMMAMVTMLLMTILAAELVYESSVYNGIVFRQVDLLRSEMLARSGLRMALLQVRATARAKVKAKGMGLADTSLVDRIWDTPLILPPPPAAVKVGLEQQAMRAFGDELGLQGTISISITGENSRLSLNQLVWNKPADTSTATGTATATTTSTSTATGTLSAEQSKKQLETTRQTMAQVIDQIFTKKKESSDTFAQKIGTLNGQILVGNLVGWMDPTTTVDGEGRDKYDYYNRHDPDSYGLKDAPLFSETELFMVKGFDDDIAKIFNDNFTSQFTGGVNVNQASALLLQALIPELGPAEAELVIKRRQDETQGGKFKSDKEFWAFMDSIGNFSASKQKIQEQGLKILGDETAYRVTITGASGQANKTWVASIGPYPPAVAAVNQQQGVDPSQQQLQQGQNPTPAAAAAQQKKTDAQGLHVLYLKAE